MEPMLLEDCKHGETPQSVTNLLNFYKVKNVVPDRVEVLVNLLYILMIEVGFVPKESLELYDDLTFNYQRILQHTQTFPDSKRNSSFQLHFILKNPHNTCTLVCVSVSDYLTINCTFKELPQCFSLLVDPLLYFTSSRVKLENCGFQNLDHLARTFKNSIAVPARNSLIHYYGGFCTCLQHLPNELIIKICSTLEVSEVFSVAQTCRKLCICTQDVSLWVKILDANFRGKGVVKSYEELRFLYEIKYARELAKIILYPERFYK